MKKLIWIGLAFFVVLVGCELTSRDYYRAEGDFPEDGKGMLVLALDGSGVANKTIAPSTTTMTIASYDITGTHASDSFPTINVLVDDLVNGSYYEMKDLKTGAWNIEVVAKNSVADRIGYGSNTIIVEPNQLIFATVDVFPDTGADYTGLLNLSILWAEFSVPQPLVVAELTAGTPNTSNVSLGSSFDISTPDTTATLTGQVLNAGYYTLHIELYKNNDTAAANFIMGDTRSVRIVSDLTTSGTWDLSGATGEAQVTIAPDLKNPIDITLDLTYLLSSGAIATLINTPPASSYFAYEWYEDGISKQGPTTFSLTQGVHSDNYISSSPFVAGSSHYISVVVTEYLDPDGGPINTISSATEIFITP